MPAHAGRAYTGADFYDTTVFGEGIQSRGATGVILAEIDPGDSGVVWSHHYGGTSWDGGDDLAVDVGGNLYVLGHHRNPARFGGQVATC